MKSTQFPIIKRGICITLCIALMTGCSKFIEVDTPPTRISTENVYNDPTNATAVITGLYARISSNYAIGGLMATSVLTELSADNVTLFDINSSEDYRKYYQNDLNPLDGATYWTSIYNLLYTINDAVEKLTSNTVLSEQLKNRLLGEAYFLRAFCYFYLTNFYGDVPLILTTQPQTNSTLPRTISADVYNQIVKDLNEAESLLTMTYVGSDGISTSTDRIRPNLGAVYALMARTYLYMKNYSLAESYATKTINTSGLYGYTSLNETFLKNSHETIWALQSVTSNSNTYPGTVFLLTSEGPNGTDHPFFAATALVKSFEAGDARKSNWLSIVKTGPNSYYYPTKYKKEWDVNITQASQLTEYDIVLRLAEQYLIRAEARNEQNNITGAVEDLNKLRSRSREAASADVPDPLPDLKTTIGQADLRTIILKERRVELFTEWGHRWFDLRRSGTIDAALKEAQHTKGNTWASYKALYPVPSVDILLNASLSQNPGYTK